MDVEEDDSHDLHEPAAAAAASSLSYSAASLSDWSAAAGAKEAYPASSAGGKGSSGSDAWSTSGGKNSSFTFLPPTRRRNPFGEDRSASVSSTKTSPLNKAANRKPFSVFEETINTLKEGARREYEFHTGVSGSDRSQMCFICRGASSSSACFFCTKPACTACMRQCELCQDVFCSFCSTINYDLRYDRIFCLSCDSEERANLADQRSKAPSHASMVFGNPF